MGMKARMAMSVAPSSGMAVFLPMEVRASARGLPLRRSTSMPSTMTMALSTSIPMARMNAAKDTRCNVPSKPLRTRNEPKTMTANDMPSITPDLNPMKKISTTTTITTDSSRLIRKV